MCGRKRGSGGAGKAAVYPELVSPGIRRRKNLRRRAVVSQGRLRLLRWVASKWDKRWTNLVSARTMARPETKIIYDKTNFPFFLLSTQQAHTIWHHHAFLLQQHNIYYTSSGPIAKVSNVKREKIHQQELPIIQIYHKKSIRYKKFPNQLPQSYENNNPNSLHNRLGQLRYHRKTLCLKRLLAPYPCSLPPWKLKSRFGQYV